MKCFAANAYLSFNNRKSRSAKEGNSKFWSGQTRIACESALARRRTKVNWGCSSFCLLVLSLLSLDERIMFVSGPC